tara:strand:- start:179 stop:631 length:453 start_codon:yes stop_codon:yes gene_type:complete
MKKFYFLFIFLLTLNCSINKVSNIHGSRFLEDKYAKIQINKTNKNDIRKLVGPPSSVGLFDNIWIYVERNKTNQSLIKLGKKKISENNIIILEFSDAGLVSKKEFFNINDMKDLKIAEKKTVKNFRQDNLVYDIFSTLREKINAPTRRKK